MRAAVFHRPKHVSTDTVPDPTIEVPGDVILKVTATAICGSDLHIYNGALPQLSPQVLGHEFMGIVEEVGSEVRELKRGDRVVVPFPISCGSCWFCQHSVPTACMKSNPKKYGPDGGLLAEKGGGLFGYTDLYGSYSGGQAQYVRVPYADVGPRKVPSGLTDEQALFLSDIVPTGYSGLKFANLQPGETVAVWGCGPVGLMTQKLAQAMGASLVIGVDVLPYRLEMAARSAGAVVIDGSKVDPVEAVRDLTAGRGADVVVEAVGMEVDRSLSEKVANALHLQRGSICSVRQCLSAVRRGGRVSVLGVFGTTYDNFPLGQLEDKGLQLWSGQAPVHNFIDELLEMVRTDKINTTDIITHRLPLEQAGHAYEIFNKKQEGCVKVVLNPWA